MICDEEWRLGYWRGRSGKKLNWGGYETNGSYADGHIRGCADRDYWRMNKRKPVPNHTDYTVRACWRNDSYAELEMHCARCGWWAAWPSATVASTVLQEEIQEHAMTCRQPATNPGGDRTA